MDINEVLEKLPPAPAGVVSWIYKDVIENTYIIYNKKRDTAVCTRCGHKFKASRFNIKHNDEGYCPKCKSYAIYKAEGIGRKNLTEYFRVLLLTHRGHTVYGTLTEITADFKEPGKPQLSKWISSIHVFNKEERACYKHYPAWYWGAEHWGEVKRIGLQKPPPTMNWYSEPRFGRTETYAKNLERVFMHSCLKYGWQPNLFKRYKFTAYDYISYIDLHLRYQSIELLAKAGFESLVAQKVDGIIGSSCINWRGCSLEKILRLPRRHIKKLRGQEIDFEDLAMFQKLSEEEKMLPWGVAEKIIKVRKYRYEEPIKKYTSIAKWAAWAFQYGVVSWDWLDYIRDCERLGLDTRKNSVLFPADFHDTHILLSRKVEEIEDKEKAEKIKAMAEKYSLDINDKHLMVQIASSQAELNFESSKLQHCVKSYGDRISLGRTLIYFIRKKEEPREPFYTLEIRPDGKFIQCRGKNNCGTTPEVESFKNLVVEEFNRQLKRRKTA